MGNLDLRVGEKYSLKRKIGSGGYGAVYLGLDEDTGDEVAIKLEHRTMESNFLQGEVKIYKTLAGRAGVPRVHWYGEECDYRVMVFDLLGPSLDDLFYFCRRRFSLKTVLMLADQLLCRFKNLHSKGIIHRDIKPNNILMGVGRRGNEVYITDMGVATNYSSTDRGSRPKRPSPVGTPPFASIRGDLGLEQSRRDDMESLGYLLVYFIRGSLPWAEHLKAPAEDPAEDPADEPSEDPADEPSEERSKERSKERDLALRQECKEKISSKDLCHGLPKEFAAYFDHVRSLQFGGKPRYDYLRRTFRNLFVREGFKYDHVFDWTILRYAMTNSEAEAGDTDSSLTSLSTAS